MVVGAADSSVDYISGWPSGYRILQTTPATTEPCSVGVKSILTSGATGTGTFTLSSSGVGRYALSFAVKDISA